MGRYCSKDTFAGCYERTYTYCTYPSKLARIIMEQGNAQLGRGYGSARDPECGGLTVEQINSLDFNAMNLSEFYGDVTAAAGAGGVADPAALAQALTEKFKRFGGGKWSLLGYCW